MLKIRKINKYICTKSTKLMQVQLHDTEWYIAPTKLGSRNLDGAEDPYIFLSPNKLWWKASTLVINEASQNEYLWKEKYTYAPKNFRIIVIYIYKNSTAPYNTNIKQL